jgi:hypothetical protein
VWVADCPQQATHTIRQPTARACGGVRAKQAKPSAMHSFAALIQMQPGGTTHRPAEACAATGPPALSRSASQTAASSAPAASPLPRSSAPGAVQSSGAPPWAAAPEPSPPPAAAASPASTHGSAAGRCGRDTAGGAPRSSAASAASSGAGAAPAAARPDSSRCAHHRLAFSASHVRKRRTGSEKIVICRSA